MKKYIFIIGRKFDNDCDVPGLQQCFATPASAQILLEDIKEKNPAKYTEYSVISTDEEWNKLPNDCYYIRAIEFMKE